jgi:hypothetical protein
VVDRRVGRVALPQSALDEETVVGMHEIAEAQPGDGAAVEERALAVADEGIGAQLQHGSGSFVDDDPLAGGILVRHRNGYRRPRSGP